MSKADKETVLMLSLKDGEVTSLTIKDRRHVISMSDKRARKDAKDREKGIKRLEKRFANGKITKASVNNRGYNRLLTLQGETTVTIDQSKLEALTPDLGHPVAENRKNKNIIDCQRISFLLSAIILGLTSQGDYSS